MRKGDSDASYEFRDRTGFCPFSLHELQPGGGRVKQVPDFDHGSTICRHRANRRYAAALDHDFMAAIGFCRAGSYRQLANRTDRRESLASETERPDIVDVVAELGCAVALNRHCQIG